jgi:hypothetical protein
MTQERVIPEITCKLREFPFYVITYPSSPVRCRVDAHLCGERCAFSGKQGCVGECVKVTLFTLESGIVDIV